MNNEVSWQYKFKNLKNAVEKLPNELDKIQEKQCAFGEYRFAGSGFFDGYDEAIEQLKLLIDKALK